MQPASRLRSSFPLCSRRAKPPPTITLTDPPHAANTNPDGTPKIIKVCTAPKEKPEQKSCDTWTFADGHYNAAHPQHPPVILVLDKLDRQNIVLHLANPAVSGTNGTIKGMVGQLSADGNSTSGGMSMSRDGAQGTFEAYWGAALKDGGTQAVASAPSPAASSRPDFGPDGPKPSCNLAVKPQVMHFCAQNCYTFNLEQDGRLHNYTNHTGQSNVQRIFDIEKWTPESVVIHRIDYGSSPRDERMQGRMPNGNCTAVSAYGDWRMSWGADLGDVYGSNQERTVAQGGNPNQPNMGAMLNQPGAAGVSGMDILKLLFGGSPADSTRAEYNRANDRCISKGDHDACMQRDRLRDRMYEMGIQP